MKHVEDATPIATVNKSRWAYKMFVEWLSVWRVRIDDGINKVLREHISTFSNEELDYCLVFFYR